MIKIIFHTICSQIFLLIVGIILSFTLFNVLDKFGRIGNILRQSFNFIFPILLGCVVSFIVKHYSNNSDGIISNSIVAGILLFLFALSSYLIAVQQWALTTDLESKLILEKTLLPNLISNIGTIISYITFLLLPISTINPFSSLIFNSIEWVSSHETLRYIIITICLITWIPFVRQGLKNFRILIAYQIIK